MSFPPLLTANLAVLLLTAGVALVYIELNRPGWIIPGALGLLSALLGLSVLVSRGVRAEGILLLGAATTVLAADLVRPTPILFAIAATVALSVGLRELSAGSPAGWPVVFACGLLIGTGTTILTRLARRARVNKRTV